MIEGDLDVPAYIKTQLSSLDLLRRDVGHVEITATLEDVELKGAQFTVGHNQEVAAAAGRVEETEPAEFVVQLGQLRLVVPAAFELVAVLVEEQRADGLEDVFFGGVVLATAASGFFALDSLEH
ncbi:hypothetical protein C6369_000060 [Rhodococcus rhodochrous]|nr:hypothetical protein C6369_000060 [Rhodococcus rhodochrous]